MENSKPPNQEIVGDQLIGGTSQLDQLSLGERTELCLVCSTSLSEGDNDRARERCGTGDLDGPVGCGEQGGER